jgi:tetratricopeptide (TPR) repeat protein
VVRLNGGMADAQVTEVRRLIDGLRRNPRTHPYHGRREYSERAREVAVMLTGMIEAGRAADVVPLARRAVDRGTDGLLHIDDSSGIIGDDLRELTGLYARACAIAPPDAIKLAAWLAASRCDGPGWPDFAVADFAPALGDAGLAELARLVEERRTNGEPGSWSATWGVSSLRKELAALSGDVDAHVAVLAQEARSGRDYGEIVSVLRKAGRDRDAEEWVRRGLTAEPLSPWTDALREQLAELLLSSGRQDEAVAMYREVLERRATLPDYLRLRKVAEQAGLWKELRGWALDYMRERVCTGRYRQVHLGQLISVLLHEDLAEEAWSTAAADPEQVSESQWLQLISLRESVHPADVLGPLARLIELGVEEASDKYRYPKAIKALRRLREDYVKTGDTAGFATYLAGLRERQRRKYSFTAKLDATFGADGSYVSRVKGKVSGLQHEGS